MRSNHKLLFLLFFLPTVSFSQNFGGNPASLKWRQINLSQARVIFPNGLDSQASRISKVISILDTATAQTIGQQHRKWNVVLLNQTTFSNAYVRLAPVISELNMTPEQNNFSTGSLRWDDNLIIHEQRHIQQFSNFNHGLTKVFSFFLGQEGQLLANGITTPDYFFEGDAVWQETLVSKQGRGRMPSFFNGMKSLWLANKNYSWMKLRSGSLKDYVPDHYELGYQLVAYGYQKYGADFWKKVTTDASNFKGLFYSFNKAIERHSGATYPQFRQDAMNYFKSVTTSSVANENANYITPLAKNNVVDYLYPQFVNDDTLIVTKRSYKEINSFYLIANGEEKKLRVKDYVIDDYFSYRNGKVVYAAYASDPRWSNRDYSVIQMLDIYTNKQVQLTSKSKYFSPDINDAGTEVLAVSVNTDGSNYLHRLNATSGKLIKEVPNLHNYFFTQTKYIDASSAVAAVRNPKGQMALIKIDLNTGETENLTAFSYNVLGYPFVKDGKVFFSIADMYSGSLVAADRIFVVSLKDKKLFRVSDNVNGVYTPAVNSKGELVTVAFTANGSRLQQLATNNLTEVAQKKEISGDKIPVASAFEMPINYFLDTISPNKLPSEKYRKSFQLFNFHSARPFANDPEFGYTFYGDNILSSFTNSITYTYNRLEKSHGFGYEASYAGWFPYLHIGGEYILNRNIDTSSNAGINFNSAKVYAGFSVPLRFIGGRTFKYFNIGSSYVIEQVPYIGITKDVLNNRSVNYISSFISFTNTSRQAVQQINPAWAQSLAVTYRNAFNFISRNKLVARTSFTFPGLFPNHSLVIDAAWQKRDTFLVDFFSKTFSQSRGYEGLSGKRMYRLGANYHLPLFYPDWGFGNIVFFQRIRTNLFYDHGSMLYKVAPSAFREYQLRSTGAEVYFDTKVWNALPVSVGVRYSRLLDNDLANPGAKNRFEVFLPFNLIPN